MRSVIPNRTKTRPVTWKVTGFLISSSGHPFANRLFVRKQRPGLESVHVDFQAGVEGVKFTVVDHPSFTWA